MVNGKVHYTQNYNISEGCWFYITVLCGTQSQIMKKISISQNIFDLFHGKVYHYSANNYIYMMFTDFKQIFNLLFYRRGKILRKCIRETWENFHHQVSSFLCLNICYLFCFSGNNFFSQKNK